MSLKLFRAWKGKKPFIWKLTRLMSLQTESTIISATLGAFNRPYKTTFLFNSLAGLLKKYFSLSKKEIVKTRMEQSWMLLIMVQRKDTRSCNCQYFFKGSCYLTLSGIEDTHILLKYLRFGRFYVYCKEVVISD